MVRHIGLIAAGLLAATNGQAAFGQVTGTVTDRQVYELTGLRVLPGATSPQPVTTQNVQVTDGAVQNEFANQLPTPGASGPGGVPIYSITNYQVATSIDNNAGYISFANNAAVTGQLARTSVGTSIDVSYRNGGSSPVAVTLDSSIIPAGFGTYVANPSGNVMGGDINHHPEAGASSFLRLQGTPASDAPVTIADAQVFFDILSGTTTVASYTAQLQLLANPDGPAYVSISPVLTTNGFLLGGSGTAQPLALANFGLIDADDPGKAVGYRWDATDIAVPLGMLAPGETRTLSYVTRVEADVLGTGLGTNVAQLLAYAGFGDPIGQHAGAGGIPDPNFPLLNLTAPTFTSDGTNATLSVGKFAGYAASPLPLQRFDGPGFAAAVPEASTWATMVAGIGLVGGAARRRSGRQRSNHAALG